LLVTERGASFGYNTLVSDMRALPILARTTGAPVIFERHPFGAAARARAPRRAGGGEVVPVLGAAAVSVGVAGVSSKPIRSRSRAVGRPPTWCRCASSKVWCGR